MHLSLSIDNDHRVGINHPAKPRSVTIFKAMTTIITTPLRHCSDCAVQCGRPHWNDTAKTEKTDQTAIMPKSTILALCVCGATRSIRNAEDSFAKVIAQMDIIVAT